MFKEIFLFELRYRLTRVSTYVYFGLLFLLAFGYISTDSIMIGGGSEKVMKNAWSSES